MSRMERSKRRGGAHKRTSSPLHDHAQNIIDRCREMARITDVPGETTRLFLSPATRDAHTPLLRWMREAGLEGRIDDAGNVRAVRLAGDSSAPRVVLFSHIDTIPNAG